jgi:hypothetical protein
VGGVTSSGPDWLARLAPAHAPPPAPWWPPAPGWWGVAALLAFAGAALCWWWLRPAHRQRRLALREFRRLRTAEGIDDRQLARRLEHLLRRYALVRHGRDTVARLSGRRWIEFVIAHGGAAWDEACGEAFLRAAYGGHTDAASADRERWLAGVEGFLRNRVRGVPSQEAVQGKAKPLNRERAPGVAGRAWLERLRGGRA